MRLECSSNIEAVKARLEQRKKADQSFTVSIENRMPYAVAVDQGYTQKVTRRQEIAMIIALKNKTDKAPVWEGKPGYSKTLLDDGEHVYQITIPPAGILAKSVAPARELVRSILSTKPLTKEVADEIGGGLESILVDNTPYDQGFLAGAWKVNVR